MTTRATRATTLAILACSACHFVSEGMQGESSSSGFTDADETFDPSAGTTQSATATASTTSSASTSSATTDESSSDGDPTFGEDATTTHGESSTGEVIEDWALAFDGGLAISDMTDLVAFDGAPYTIEMWVRITGEFGGVLFDTTIPSAGAPNGVTLVRDPSWTSTDEIAYYDFGSTPWLQITGADPNDLSAAWHHIAITSDGEIVTIWIDGTQNDSIPAPAILDNATASVVLGSRATTPFVPLSGVEIDELRILDYANYSDAFVPERELTSEGALLFWGFDEGTGDVAVDDAAGLSMNLSGEIVWAVVD